MVDKKHLILAPRPGMQVAALSSPATEVLMGGEAGGGKSWLILLKHLACAKEVGGKYRGLILRRTAPNLGRLIEMAREMYIPCGWKFKAMDTEYKKACFVAPNGSKIIFGHMQHTKDMHNYQGQEYYGISFDELTHFSEQQYLYIFSRARNPEGVMPWFLNSANPDGEHMQWVKRRFIDKLKAGELGWFRFNQVLNKDERVPAAEYDHKKTMAMAEQGDLFAASKLCVMRQWIKSVRSENKSLGAAYSAMLNQLPQEMYNALAKGEWKSYDKPNQLILSDWIDKAFSGENSKNVEDSIYFGTRSIGFDYAEGGKDLSVLCSGVGGRPMTMKSWPYTSPHDAARFVFEETLISGRDYVSVGVDCNGPGSGVGSVLVTDYNIKNLTRCTHKDPVYDELQRKKYSGKIKFDCFRSQAAWKLRTDFEEGSIDLSWLVRDENFLGFESLKEELHYMTYTVQNGYVRVISKNDLKKGDNLGRSPDWFDALMIWNWVRERHELKKVPTPDEELEGLFVENEAETDIFVDLLV